MDNFSSDVSRNQNVSLQAYDGMHVPFIRINLCPIPVF